MGSRLGGWLVVLLALLVVGGTAWGYRDWRGRVDETVAQSATEPEPAAGPAPGSGAAEPRPGGQVVSLWIGDGYTAGVGAPSPEDGYACTTAEELGWTCEVAAAEGAAFAGGPGRPALAERLEELGRVLDEDPDVVVVDAGRNDLRAGPAPALPGAMDGFLGRLRAAYPDAVLVQVVPWSLGQDGPLPGGVAGTVQDLMRRYDGYVVDPVGEGWAGAGRTDRPPLQLDRGGVSPEGHAYIAERLARALRRLELPVGPAAG